MTSIPTTLVEASLRDRRDHVLLNHALRQSAALPSGLLARAGELARLDQALQHWLIPRGEWARHVMLANYQPPQVTLVAANAAAATPLRYLQSQLLGWLSQQTGERLTRLEIRVQALPGTRRGRV